MHGLRSDTWAPTSWHVFMADCYVYACFSSGHLTLGWRCCSATGIEASPAPMHAPSTYDTCNFCRRHCRASGAHCSHAPSAYVPSAHVHNTHGTWLLLLLLLQMRSRSSPSALAPTSHAHSAHGTGLLRWLLRQGRRHTPWANAPSTYAPSSHGTGLLQELLLQGLLLQGRRHKICATCPQCPCPQRPWHWAAAGAEAHPLRHMPPVLPTPMALGCCCCCCCCYCRGGGTPLRTCPQCLCPHRPCPERRWHWVAAAAAADTTGAEARRLRPCPQRPCPQRPT